MILYVDFDKYRFTEEKMNFKTVSASGTLEGYCIVKSVEKRITSKGSRFLDMKLADNSGEIDAKLWNYDEAVQGTFKPYDFIKIRGALTPFNDSTQLRIERIRHVTEEDNVNIDDFVPSAVLSGKEMLEEIEKTVAAFEDEDLKKLVSVIIDEYRDRLVYWPGAKSLHHALRSGLLMHTLSILRLAQGVTSVYPFLNKDLLYAGVILHDIAKTEEIDSSESGISSDYTAEGNLLGHLVMGAMIVDRTGRREGINPETLTLLEHMLISHHGSPEFGSAKLTMFPEAEVLSQLDLLDARLYEMATALDETNPGEFSGKMWALDNRKLYNHGRDGKFTAKLD